MSVKQHCDISGCEVTETAGPLNGSLLTTFRHKLPEGWGYVIANVNGSDKRIELCPDHLKKATGDALKPLSIAAQS